MNTITAPRAKKRFSTRLLLTCAAIGAAGGLLVVGLNYLSFATTAIAFYIYGATIGIWGLPVLLAQRLLQRGGVAVITGTIMGLVNAPLTPYGVLQIGNFVIVGLLLEVPFLLFRYRRWTDRVFWIGHVLTLVVLSAAYTLTLGLTSITPVVLLAMTALALGVAVACTALARVIAARLQAAGVGHRPRS